MLKIKILEIFTNLKLRFFKANLLSRQTSNLVQFHSGGDDYSPLLECEGLGGFIGNNPANGYVLAWRDDVLRKSLSGEKRIYSILFDEENQKPVLDDTQNMTVASEIYLKRDGSIEINANKDLNIAITGNATLKMENGILTIKAKTIKTSGEWTHAGNFKASHIEAEDGATGSFDVVSANKGIVM